MESIKNFKQISVFKYSLIILMSSILLAISAKLKIPFYPVPMTMQTFVVLLIGVCFGWKLGGTIITFYLLEGIIGLPVFSGTPEKGSGIIYFFGPTMGYLLGFVFAAMLCGIFKFNKNITSNFLKSLRAALQCLKRSPPQSFNATTLSKCILLFSTGELYLLRRFERSPG